MKWHRIWLSLLLIGISIAISMLIGFGDNRDMMRSFSFSDFTLRGSQVFYQNLDGVMASGQWWRFLTPIFMHFSVMHIVFNLLWVWVIGTRIERQQGSVVLLLLVLISGIASNLAQFLISGPMFGGMSGVVFALIAYVWVWDRFSCRPGFGFPPALMGFMVVWLALGYAGVLEGLGMGAVANTAHLVGLLAGLLFLPLGRLLAGRVW